MLRRMWYPLLLSTPRQFCSKAAATQIGQELQAPTAMGAAVAEELVTVRQNMVRYQQQLLQLEEILAVNSAHINELWAALAPGLPASKTSVNPAGAVSAGGSPASSIFSSSPSGQQRRAPTSDTEAAQGVMEDAQSTSSGDTDPATETNSQNTSSNSLGLLQHTDDVSWEELCGRLDSYAMVPKDNCSSAGLVNPALAQPMRGTGNGLRRLQGARPTPDAVVAMLRPLYYGLVDVELPCSTSNRQQLRELAMAHPWFTTSGALDAGALERFVDAAQRTQEASPGFLDLAMRLLVLLKGR